MESEWIESKYSDRFEKWFDSRLLERVVGEDWDYGFQALEDHGNSGGSVHGGILMMAADHLMSMCILRMKTAPSHIATIQMESHFLKRARPGDFLVVKPRVMRQAREVVFVDCGIYNRESLLFSARGIWKVVKP